MPSLSSPLLAVGVLAGVGLLLSLPPQPASASVLASMVIAKERELGTLEQLMVTPLRRYELDLGKGIPALAVGALNFAVMWGISLVLFQVPMNGSPALLVGLTLLFITAIVSWGVVISSVSRTQQQAILMVFILAMVDMAFSGFMVPVRNMPPLFQAISSGIKILPGRK